MAAERPDFKNYRAAECCIFRKTTEEFGGLSNMAGGFPLIINGTPILTSEALYQACRFPHLPEVQKKIIGERSPMSAKMAGKPFRHNSRPDWDEVRGKIMRWCLRVKLAQNVIRFGQLLESTAGRPIVEDSTKDDFWGAIRERNNPESLRGVNALGRLLMELRKFYNQNHYSYDLLVVPPPDISQFYLFGEPIRTVDERANFLAVLHENLWLPGTEVQNRPVAADYTEINQAAAFLHEPPTVSEAQEIPQVPSGKKKKPVQKKRGNAPGSQQTIDF